MPKLVQKIVCGFGNQLFFIFNALSLCIDYNLDLEIELKSIDKKRNIITKYLIFSSDKLKKAVGIKTIGYKRIINTDFFYKKVILSPNSNYVIDGGKDGFFQSYKYFYHNKDKIKEYLNVPNEKFTKYGDIIKSFGTLGKKTLAIHIRLTDYLKNPQYFYNYPTSYYIEVLSKYNLDEYQIILFSDDSKMAYDIISKIIPNEKIILADQYSLDDEDQFVMLCYTDLRILCNSTYSLWSCYLNDIYGFNENSIYWFGDKWFGPRGPKYILDDLLPKDNFKYNIYSIK